MHEEEQRHAEFKFQVQRLVSTNFHGQARTESPAYRRPKQKSALADAPPVVRRAIFVPGEKRKGYDVDGEQINSREQKFFVQKNSPSAAKFLPEYIEKNFLCQACVERL